MQRSLCFSSHGFLLTRCVTPPLQREVLKTANSADQSGGRPAFGVLDQLPQTVVKSTCVTWCWRSQLASDSMHCPALPRLFTGTISVSSQGPKASSLELIQSMPDATTWPSASLHRECLVNSECASTRVQIGLATDWPYCF